MTCKWLHFVMTGKLSNWPPAAVSWKTIWLFPNGHIGRLLLSVFVPNRQITGKVFLCTTNIYKIVESHDQIFNVVCSGIKMLTVMFLSSKCNSKLESRIVGSTSKSAMQLSLQAFREVVSLSSDTFYFIATLKHTLIKLRFCISAQIKYLLAVNLKSKRSIWLTGIAKINVVSTEKSFWYWCLVFLCS